MNFEYCACGSIKHKGSSQSMLYIFIKDILTKFIIMPNLYKQLIGKTIHTGTYSILANGGLATDDFADERLIM